MTEIQNIYNIVNNMKLTIDNLVSHTVKSNQIKNTSDDKFIKINKIIDLLNNEIQDIKLQLNNKSNDLINNDFDKINIEINNLKNMIQINNDQSMCLSNNDEIFNELDKINNSHINENYKIYNIIQDIKTEFIFLKNELKIDIDNLKFTIIDNDFNNEQDYKTKNIKLRNDEIIKVRELFITNENLYKTVNDDINNIQNNYKDEIDKLKNEIIELKLINNQNKDDILKLKSICKTILTKNK